MEQTPRLPDGEGQHSSPAEEAAPPPAQPAADPEELRDALLDGGLESPPAVAETPGQLRRDLSRALLQAGALASPRLDDASGSMPPLSWVT